MREIRYLDKLVDELAKGKAMEQILRSPVRFRQLQWDRTTRGVGQRPLRIWYFT